MHSQLRVLIQEGVEEKELLEVSAMANVCVLYGIYVSAVHKCVYCDAVQYVSYTVSAVQYVSYTVSAVQYVSIL